MLKRLNHCFNPITCFCFSLGRVKTSLVPTRFFLQLFLVVPSNANKTRHNYSQYFRIHPNLVCRVSTEVQEGPTRDQLGLAFCALSPDRDLATDVQQLVFAEALKKVENFGSPARSLCLLAILSQVDLEPGLSNLPNPAAVGQVIAMDGAEAFDQFEGAIISALEEISTGAVSREVMLNCVAEALIALPDSFRAQTIYLCRDMLNAAMKHKKTRDIQDFTATWVPVLKKLNATEAIPVLRKLYMADHIDIERAGEWLTTSVRV